MMDKYVHNQILNHLSEITLCLHLAALISPPAEVERPFSLIKLVDTRPRCCLSEENLARCMRICKIRELLGPDYQAIF